MPVKDAKSIASKFLLPALNFQSHRRPAGGNFEAPQNMGGLCFQVLGSLGSYIILVYTTLIFVSE